MLQIREVQSAPDIILPKKIQQLWEKFERLVIRTAFNCLHCCQQRRRRERKRIIRKEERNKGSSNFKDYQKAIQIRKKLKNNELTQRKSNKEDIWEDLNWLKRKTDLLNELPIQATDFDLPNINEEWKNIKAQIDIAILALKELSYKEEKKKMNIEIKEAIQKRCSDFQSNQRKTIQALTNSHREKIVIDRIKVLEATTKEFITTEKEEIFQQVENHYNDIFRKKNSGFEHLDEAWKNQYVPQIYIQEE